MKTLKFEISGGSFVFKKDVDMGPLSLTMRDGTKGNYSYFGGKDIQKLKEFLEEVEPTRVSPLPPRAVTDEEVASAQEACLRVTNKEALLSEEAMRVALRSILDSRADTFNTLDTRRTKCSEPNILNIKPSVAVSISGSANELGHWIKEPAGEPPAGLRRGNYSQRRQDVAAIEEAGRYALRRATKGYTKSDFSPDDVIANLVIGLLGYFSKEGRTYPPGAVTPKKKKALVYDSLSGPIIRLRFKYGAVGELQTPFKCEGLTLPEGTTLLGVTFNGKTIDFQTLEEDEDGPSQD